MSRPTERPEVAVGAIVTDAQGRVLLIQRGHPPSQGKWTIPGGRVERGETLEQALLRELQAETGLTARRGPLAEVFEYIDDSYHYIILDYLMTEPSGELRAGEDATQAAFVALSELGEYQTTDGLAAVLKRVLGPHG
jgi:mutator protein MutT